MLSPLKGINLGLFLETLYCSASGVKEQLGNFKVSNSELSKPFRSFEKSKLVSGGCVVLKWTDTRWGKYLWGSSSKQTLQSLVNSCSEWSPVSIDGMVIWLSKLTGTHPSFIKTNPHSSRNNFCLLSCGCYHISFHPFTHFLFSGTGNRKHRTHGRGHSGRSPINCIHLLTSNLEQMIS